MESDGIGATLEDVERLLRDRFDSAQHRAVREQLARLEHAPMVEGDAARIKAAAIIVSDGNWSRLVDAVDLGLLDWRDLLVSAFYDEDEVR